MTDLIISERKNIIKLNYVNKRILILGLLFCLPDVYLNASGNNASNLKDESRQTEQGIQNVEDFPISDEIFSTWLEWLVSNVEKRNSFLADYLQWESVEDYSECQSDYLKLEQYIRMCIKLTAWHEAGHAIFHLDRYQRGRSEICLATIIPKGKVTGEVRSLRFKAPKNIASIKHDVLFCLAGRSGERLFF